MSQVRKCCVVACNATSETHRLFYLPKNDKLRELWLTFLIPVNVKLSGLSKAQLVTKQVCQKHFDRHQFDNQGNRLAHGYPCLFTEDEILHGVPLSTLAEHDLRDHNYALQPTNLEDTTVFTESTIVIAKDSMKDHDYALSYQIEGSVDLAEGTSTNVKTDGKCNPTVSEMQTHETLEILDNQPVSILGTVSTGNIYFTGYNIIFVSKIDSYIIRKYHDRRSHSTVGSDPASCVQGLISITEKYFCDEHRYI
ncbi:uncharacterized protein LOC128199822 [Bicyclus anynana]|uniref:Uncharacterized protein LOC128199822 n=1 Tax=Bicyclus anynana TaxID=110368 RepID=A0ABM3M7N1_BICAN|nr:uncharacterized protein LOC128199822 [Bicyclus anynana]